MDAARGCKDLEANQDEILAPPYYGNSNRCQLDCTDRIVRKLGKSKTVVDCLTLCAQIPIEWLGGTTPNPR